MKIGEVSRLLGIPVTTIRFYEEEGVLSPSRKKEGKYREYTTWDIINLLECIRLRNIGLSVKEVSELLHHEPISYFQQCIENRIETLEKQIENENFLLHYLHDFISHLKIITHNIGNFWIVEEPEKCYLKWEYGPGNGFGELMVDENSMKLWSQHLPFVSGADLLDADSLIESPETLKIHSCLLAEKAIAKRLKLLNTTNLGFLPRKMYVKTIVNSAGSPLHNLQKLRSVTLQVKQRYHIKGQIIAQMVARCGDEKHPQRYWQILFPLQD